MTQPILVTGSHRSGTTWVGRMLDLSGETAYLHEPFNPLRKPGWAGDRIPYWYLYVTTENEAYYRDAIRRVLDLHYPAVANLRDVRTPKGAALYARDVVSWARFRTKGRPLRPLLKDPIALFAAPWLHDSFAAQVIVMIRHPAAFVSSIKKLDWRFRFRSWLAQEALLRDHLHPFVDDMRRAAASDDVIEQGIVMWNAIHTVIDTYRRGYPEWSFVRHEDLSLDPLTGFRELYSKLDLTWSTKVEAGVRASTGESNPGEVTALRHGSTRRDSAATARVWRHRLTEEEVARVRQGTQEVAARFYDEAIWT